MSFVLHTEGGHLRGSLRKLLAYPLGRFIDDIHGGSHILCPRNVDVQIIQEPVLLVLNSGQDLQWTAL